MSCWLMIFAASPYVVIITRAFHISSLAVCYVVTLCRFSCYCHAFRADVTADAVMLILPDARYAIAALFSPLFARCAAATLRFADIFVTLASPLMFTPPRQIAATPLIDAAILIRCRCQYLRCLSLFDFSHHASDLSCHYFIRFSPSFDVAERCCRCCRRAATLIAD